MSTKVAMQQHPSISHNHTIEYLSPQDYFADDLGLDKLGQQIIDSNLLNIGNIPSQNIEPADIYIFSVDNKDPVTVIPSTSIQTTKFINIDGSLQNYYDRLGYEDYLNNDGIGIFMQYIMEQELDDMELPINDELGDKCDPNECDYLDFIDLAEFPMPEYVTISHENKRLFIFYLLQYCYKYNHAPSKKYIETVLLPKIQGSTEPTALGS